MSIELKKDILRIEEISGKEESQVLVDTEVYLTPSKPNIEKILWADGTVDILSTKVTRGSIIVSGVVKFKVVYRALDETKNIYTLDSNADFKEEIEIPNITEEMSASVKSNIEYIEEEILDEKKLSLRALVSLKGKVHQVNNIEVIKGIEEKEVLQTLREKIKYKEIQGRETSYANIEETFQLEEDSPPIEEILKISINAYEEEAKVVEDRIIISGIVNPRIIYYGEGEIGTIEEEIHFNHFLEMPGVLPESLCEISMEVAEGNWEVLEDEDGQLKVLDFEVNLRISGNAFFENEKELIVDAYSTEEKVNIEREKINLIEEVGSLIHKENVYKDLQEYNIKEIYDVSGYPSIIDSRFGEDGLIVEGILSLQVIYLEEDSEEIKTLVDEIPYKYYLPTDENVGGSDIDIDLNVENIKVKENSNIEGTIKHKINLRKNRLLSVINSIEGTGEIIDKKNRPSIIIYIVQKDDILWDIAKRYNTTIEEILEANENINPNNIMPGEKIIIEKKIDVSL